MDNVNFFNILLISDNSRHMHLFFSYAYYVRCLTHVNESCRDLHES